MKKEVKRIYNLSLAQDLIEKGFRAVRLERNEKESGKVIFVFIETDEFNKECDILMTLRQMNKSKE